MDLIRTLASRSTDGSLILDIGSNIGGHTNLFLGYKGVIHAFEPCPKLAEGLRERFKDEPRVTVFQQGVSDRCYTETGLTVFEAWTLGKAEQPNKRGPSLGALEQVGHAPFDVEFTTVDGHILGMAYDSPVLPVDFMKIDTDGYELRVLKGAAEMIMNFRPNILIELSYMVEDIGDSIDEFRNCIHNFLGYNLYSADGNRLPYETWREWYPFNTSFDVAMVPKEREFVPL